MSEHSDHSRMQTVVRYRFESRRCTDTIQQIVAVLNNLVLAVERRMLQKNVDIMLNDTIRIRDFGMAVETETDKAAHTRMMMS